MPSKSHRIKPVIEEVTSDTPNPPEVAKELSAEEQSHQEHAKEIISDIKEMEPPAPMPMGENKKGGRSLKLLFAITILTALVVGFVSGGIYVYFTGVKSLGGTDNTAAETPTPEPVAAPTPSPSPEPVDLTTYKVEVLNGSGKIGEASKVKDLLEKGGFTVSATANASKFDYAKTVVQAKADVPKAAVNKVTSALFEVYTLETGDALPASSKYDIVVTVGLN